MPTQVIKWLAIYSLNESNDLPFIQEGVLHNISLDSGWKPIQFVETTQDNWDVQSRGFPARSRNILVLIGWKSGPGASKWVILLLWIIILDKFGIAFQMFALTKEILLFAIMNAHNVSYSLLSQSPCNVVIRLWSKCRHWIVLASALIGGTRSKSPGLKDKDIRFENPWKYVDWNLGKGTLRISNMPSGGFNGCIFGGSSKQFRSIIKVVSLSKPQKAFLCIVEKHPLIIASVWNYVNAINQGLVLNSGTYSTNWD